MNKKKDKQDNPCYSASVQKSIKKLISEEWFAGNMYQLFIESTDEEERPKVAGLFDQIAEDETNDHMKGLIKAAKMYGYDVPASYCDFKKNAGAEDRKVFEEFKSGKGAEHYLKLAIESEIRAIQSYEEALKDKSLSLCPEVEIAMTNNYYDECEHLQMLKFSMIAFQAGIIGVQQ